MKYVSMYLKLFHTSNSRGRFPTTLLTLSQRAKARTSDHSLLDWINTTNKEASDHHLPLSLTMTNTHKRTHLHTKSYSDVLIHLSLTGSLASDVECVTPCDTQTHCFITENAGRKTQIAPFGASVTLELVSYSSRGGSLSVEASGLCWLCPLSHPQDSDDAREERVWCFKLATRWHCGKHSTWRLCCWHTKTCFVVI